MDGTKRQRPKALLSDPVLTALEVSEDDFVG